MTLKADRSIVGSRYSGILRALATAVGLLSVSAALAVPVNNGFTAPGGDTRTPNNVQLGDGTRVWTYTGFSPSNYSALYWTGTGATVSLGSGSNLGPLTPGGGVGHAQAFGTSTQSTTGGVINYETFFDVFVTDINNVPISLDPGTTVGLGGVPFLANVTSAIAANGAFKVAAFGGARVAGSGGAFLPTNQAFSNGNNLGSVSQTGFSTGPFYFDAPVQGGGGSAPEPVSLALFGLGLAGLALSRRRRS